MNDIPTPRPSTEAAVAVVGAGPVGAVVALELARHGIPSIVLERSRAASTHPKMDYLNARSMELLRRLGLAEQLRRRGVPEDQPLTFLWSTGFADPPVAEWRYPSVADLATTIARLNDGSQPCEPYQRVIGSRFEDLARSACRSHPLIDLREGVAVQGCTQDEAGVTVDVYDAAEQRSERLRTRYLIGCDGANSTVRRAAGIDVDQIGPVSMNCNVYFRSSDPALLEHGRFFLAVAAAGLTLVSRDGAETWTAVFPRHNGEPFTGDPVPVIRRLLGVDIDVDEVISVANWENRLTVATTYGDRRIFLAGDAAHQFFPSGGHGANTGIADAVDLGWKLAAVLDGWADRRLLESYQLERRPVALFNREMCFALMEVWRRFMFLAKDGASRAQLAGYLAHQSFHTANLGIHCGYRYHGSPIVIGEDGPEPPWDSQAVIPSTWPGGRAPSVRLADGRMLFDSLGPEYTLVDLSSRAAGAPLTAPAARRGIPVRHLIIDDPQVRRAWERDLVLVRPDQHVAWRGDDLPDDLDALLDRITGRSTFPRQPMTVVPREPAPTPIRMDL
jgi:2-polyprenyl-6-methoxyphenol hydroxylase-like FAD-dependent oxidoreductase